MKAVLLLGIVMFSLLGAAVLYSVEVWMGMEGGPGMSGHGLMALALGVAGTLLLGVVLMALVFYSRRKGFDDEAGH